MLISHFKEQQSLRTRIANKIDPKRNQPPPQTVNQKIRGTAATVGTIGAMGALGYGALKGGKVIRKVVSDKVNPPKLLAAAKTTQKALPPARTVSNPKSKKSKIKDLLNRDVRDIFKKNAKPRTDTWGSKLIGK